MGTYRRKILMDRNKVRRLHRGVWENSSDPIMRSIFQSDPHCEWPIFVDGGAAFGYYSIMALQEDRGNRCRQVHAFNPHAKFAASMRLNLEDNAERLGLDITSNTKQRVCINQVALDAKTHDERKMFGFGYENGLGRGVEQMSVRVASLDSFFAQWIDSGQLDLDQEKRKVLLVKFDIEAAELEALRGSQELLKNCRVKNWVIGIHDEDFVRPITELLVSNGYNISQAVAFVRGQPNGEVVASCNST